MTTNKQIMGNWQIDTIGSQGRISNALDDARSDAIARILKLPTLAKAREGNAKWFRDLIREITGEFGTINLPNDNQPFIGGCQTQSKGAMK